MELIHGWLYLLPKSASDIGSSLTAATILLDLDTGRSSTSGWLCDFAPFRLKLKLTIAKRDSRGKKRPCLISNIRFYLSWMRVTQRHSRERQPPFCPLRKGGDLVKIYTIQQSIKPTQRKEKVRLLNKIGLRQ